MIHNIPPAPIHLPPRPAPQDRQGDMDAHGKTQQPPPPEPAQADMRESRKATAREKLARIRQDIDRLKPPAPAEAEAAAKQAAQLSRALAATARDYAAAAIAAAPPEPAAKAGDGDPAEARIARQLAEAERKLSARRADEDFSQNLHAAKDALRQRIEQIKQHWPHNGAATDHAGIRAAENALAEIESMTTGISPATPAGSALNILV